MSGFMLKAIIPRVAAAHSEQLAPSRRASPVTCFTTSSRQNDVTGNCGATDHGVDLIMPTERDLSPLEKQAADALRRARRLPIGPNRNDLRQLAMGLLWLHRNGMRALEQTRTNLFADQDETSRS